MPSTRFAVEAPFQPAGDQPQAIAALVAGLQRGDRYQTLLGVTGSGKTMTLGNGFGHGVGLCQWGAIALSRMGWKYKEILEHYYPGTLEGTIDDKN